MAMGGPDSLEAVGPYLNDVRGGRLTPPELVQEITERYRATGSKSPVLAITREVARRLEDRLNATGDSRFKVYVGLRHWHPYIRETYQEIVKDGVRRVVGVCFTYVPNWHTRPALIRGIVANIREALKKFPPDARDRVALIFTAHSLPERILAAGDPYPGQVRQTVEAVLAALGPLPSGATWRFAYQSQGRSEEQWLGPSVEATLDELHGLGFRHVLMAPIGFVSDHLEVLYDIDIEFKKRASEKGMRLERMAMLNATPPLIETLLDVLTTHLRETGL